MSTPLQFDQVPGTALYVINVPGNVGWAAYVMPTTKDLPEHIPIDQSLYDYGGYYVFAVTAPPMAATDPAGFANIIVPYVNKNTKNRAVVWLKGIDPLSLGDFGNFAFPFNQDIRGNYLLSGNINAGLGQSLNFFALAQLNLDVDTTVGALSLTIRTSPSVSKYIGFQKGRSNLDISLIDGKGGQRAYIPFSGTNAGCFTFQAVLGPATTFGPSGVDLGFKYIVNNAGTEQLISYPGFNVAPWPKTLSAAGTIDPSDPVNARISQTDLEAGYLRSGLAIANAPTLASYFRTPEGKTISLTPIGSSSTDIAPALGAGAFALQSASPSFAAPGTATAYFAPAGKFGMSVDGKAAATPQQLLCGLFGSERLSFITYDPRSELVNDTIYFLPSQPAYAPIFPYETVQLEKPDSGGIRPRLTPTYRTPWATIQAGSSPDAASSAIAYSAQPEGGALYGLAGGQAAAADAPTVLVSTPPRHNLPQGVTKTFPLAPYAGATKPGVDPNTLTQFESQIISATRKTIISAASTALWEARAAAVQRIAKGADPDKVQYGTTPQGLIAQVDPDTFAYANVRLAQSVIGSGPTTTLPFAFVKPHVKVQNALQTNQLFLVAVNNQYFDDQASGAKFENVVNIADWTMAAQIGKNATPTSYRNVMIMKFCDGSLVDRITNPNRWTDPADFSLVKESGGIESLAYTGLSQWLQDYVKDGIARADGPLARFYKNFKQIVTDPYWNGVIVLRADLSFETLPKQIQGLAAGIDFTQFNAHHFGFTVSRVAVAGTQIRMDGNSSLFGLIDYENPSYLASLSSGLSPDTPISVLTNTDFAFTVLQLTVLFENAKLVDFQSHVQLTVDKLFESKVVKAYSNSIPMPANGVVLDGSYVDQGGAAAYVFEQTHSTVFTLDSNVLPAVAFNRVQFNTLGPEDNGATTVSRFVIWSAFDFTELTETKDTVEQLFDVLSFGSPPDTLPSNLGQGLAASNLILRMAFPTATPNATVFALNTDNMAYDLNASASRDKSLFKGFGLQLKTFINASGGKTPADYGFLPVSSGLNLQLLGTRWFGVVYQVTMGGPGALASAAGFTSNMLLAWSPDTKLTEKKQHSVFIGLSLPGAAPGAKLFSLQGVLKVSLGNITLQRQPVYKDGVPSGQDYYCLRLDDIALKIFGIVKLPPDANIQFFLFGDPDNTGSLGWYAAYVAKDQPKSSEAAPAALPGGQAVALLED